MIAALALLGSHNLPQQPSIAIIIDDLGNRPAQDARALALPNQVAVSVLPEAPAAKRLALKAGHQGREVLVHLPMQSQSGLQPESGELHTQLDRWEFSQRVRRAISQVPGAVGINNHQGSLLTQDRRAMNWLMADLRCLPPRYFVDSRTTEKTQALLAAREAGVPSTQRDVFLDWNLDAQTIHHEFDRLISLARRQGHALAIAHPHPTTLAVLEERLAELDLEGVSLVPLSTYLELSQWQSKPTTSATFLANQSSSRSPRAAKNSRPLPSSTSFVAPASR